MFGLDIIVGQSLMILKGSIAKRQFYLVGWYFLDFFYLLLDGHDSVLRSHADCHPSQHLLILKNKDVDYLIVDDHVPYHIILARRKHKFKVFEWFYVIIVSDLFYLVGASIDFLRKGPVATIETIGQVSRVDGFPILHLEVAIT